MSRSNIDRERRMLAKLRVFITALGASNSITCTRDKRSNNITIRIADVKMSEADTIFRLLRTWHKAGKSFRTILRLLYPDDKDTNERQK